METANSPELHGGSSSPVSFVTKCPSTSARRKLPVLLSGRRENAGISVLWNPPPNATRPSAGAEGALLFARGASCWISQESPSWCFAHASARLDKLFVKFSVLRVR